MNERLEELKQLMAILIVNGKIDSCLYEVVSSEYQSLKTQIERSEKKRAQQEMESYY